jgi:hypothetical protein
MSDNNKGVKRQLRTLAARDLMTATGGSAKAPLHGGRPTKPPFVLGFVPTKNHPVLGFVPTRK